MPKLNNISCLVQLLAFGLATVLGWEEQGYGEHRGWEALGDKHDGGWEVQGDEHGRWEIQGGEHGRWEAQQAAAGSQMGGWEVQQQPEYQDLQQQENHLQQYDQQHYDQQELYGEEKDQQYYAQFRAQIDQIQRGGGSGRFENSYLEPKSYQGIQENNYLEPSYRGLEGRGVERDDQQRLFGSEREFGEPVDPVLQFGGSDPVFQFGKEFGESDPMLHFGKDTVSLGQPVAWEEARKRLEKITKHSSLIRFACFVGF